MANHKMHVEVAYATPQKQVILEVLVDVDATLEAIILESRILDIFPEIDLSSQKIGIFGKMHDLSEAAQEGDRIEIYRPLTIDPKEARRAKAKKKR